MNKVTKGKWWLCSAPLRSNQDQLVVEVYGGDEDRTAKKDIFGLDPCEDSTICYLIGRRRGRRRKLGRRRRMKVDDEVDRNSNMDRRGAVVARVWWEVDFVSDE